MNKKLISLLLVGLPFYATTYATTATAASAEAGKAKSAVCVACHGADGISAVPIYPNLKGQKEVYLASSLKAYKASQRQGGMSALMIPQAAMLSDEDIADLAAYYSSLK